jgi:hypothetical protein
VQAHIPSPSPATKELNPVRERSKLLFGNSDRVEVVTAIATSKSDIVNATELCKRLPGWQNNRVRAQLIALSGAGLLEALPRADRSIWYERRQLKFWDACVELIELWGQ